GEVPSARWPWRESSAESSFADDQYRKRALRHRSAAAVATRRRRRLLRTVLGGNQEDPVRSGVQRQSLRADHGPDILLDGKARRTVLLHHRQRAVPLRAE